MGAQFLGSKVTVFAESAIFGDLLALAVLSYQHTSYKPTKLLITQARDMSSQNWNQLYIKCLKF